MSRSSVADASSFLIVRMSSLGDIINTLPLLVAVRRKFPEARIGWVVEERFAAALEGHPYIDDLHVVPLRTWARQARNPVGLVRSLGELAAMRRRLRAARYDVCLDVHGIVKSAVMIGFAGCKTSITFRDSSCKWHSTMQIDPGEPPAAPRFMAMAHYLGAENPDYDYCFHIPGPDLQVVQDLVAGHDFGAGGPLVALNPGASAAWRQWPARSFADVGIALQKRQDARIVILGGPNEVHLAEAIAAQIPGKPLVAAGRCTIKQLAALIRACDLLVTADTGPMHMAAAVHTPTVSFFGSADPKRTGPVGDFHSIVMATGPGCVPCLNKPSCQGYPCLEHITPQTVIEAALHRLSLPRPAPAQVPVRSPQK